MLNQSRPDLGIPNRINLTSSRSSGQILKTQGAGANPVWSATGAGSVTSVGLSLPGIITVTGSPVTTTGTLTGTLATQSANLVWAGPTTGAAAAPTFRSLVGADLPNPGASSLGGIQSTTGTSHQWISSISTSGVPGLTQPAFTDISGTVAASQLPNPTASTLGGIESLAAVTSKWINAISTSGVPSATQPAFSDISGGATLAQLPTIGNNTVLSNVSGGSSTPLANSLSAIIDSGIGSAQGDVLYRGASTWSVLAPGINGQVLSTGGAAANPSWTTVTGTGTVTSVATNNGLTGGPVTSSGTIGLATIATGNVLAYTSGGTGVPVATAPTAVLDVIGSTEGNILYRGVSSWSALAPGTAGQFLQTRGAGSTPSWASAVTSITAGTGLTGGTITTTGTISVTTPFPSGAWTVFTPTITAGSGTFTTVSATGSYIQVGQMVSFICTITITSVGTAAGNLFMPLPAGTLKRAFACVGLETAVTGKIVNAFNSASASSLMINTTGGATVATSGYVLTFSGTYEAS